MTNAAMPDPRGSAAHDTVESIVEALNSAIEAKDFRIRRHSERVAGYTEQFSDQLALLPHERATLRYGALLHDIGNIGIADSILLKPGGLSDWEFDEVRMHPIIGEQICKPLQTLAPILPLIRSHHEKLNGSGYPDGLRGDNIPLLVQMLSVADVYDTLRSDRAYRGAFGHMQAIDILLDEVQRGWWDREIVEMMAAVSTPEDTIIEF